jgi:hypothetical protein
VLYNWISVQDYEECQDDVLAVSGMAEDIRDALLDYQVGGNETCAVIISLTLERLDRRSTNGRYTTRTAG